MKNRIKAIWLFLRIWDIRTLIKNYNTQDEWENAGSPLDYETAWEVAKGIWLDD